MVGFLALGLTLVAFGGGAAGQEEGGAAAAPPPERYEIRRAESAIEVDGVLDEPAWATALTIPIRYEWSPGDNVEPLVATDVLLTYDEGRLYVAFRAADPEPGAIRAHLMDRDQITTFVQDDHVTLMIDTFNDERRAFEFRVNPLGVQADAIFSEVDGIEDFSWDVIWDSAGRIDEKGFVVELALPFNQLRFPRGAGAQTWGFELSRSYPRSKRHRMSANRRDRDRSCILCQITKVSGFAGLEPGRNLELDPTLTGQRTDRRRGFPGGPLESGEEDFEPGLTARWGVTPSLQLLGTLNPDFSQVEADVAQLDVNERFALFFEEKRPFFLEGVDFFTTPIDAVFTRTVADPDWGVKLNGKQGRNALGVFVAEDTVNSFLIPSNQRTDFGFIDESLTAAVLRYRRDLGANSTLGVLFTGREGDRYHNRVGGLDGFFRLSDVDTVEFQYLRSDTLYPDGIAAAFGQPAAGFTGEALSISYDHEARHWRWFLEYEDFDPGFRADSGFVRRVDFRRAEAILIRRWWGGDEEWWDRVDVGLFSERTEDHDGQLTDESFDLFANVSGPLQSFAEISLERNREFFGGVLYEDMEAMQFYAEVQPGGAVRLQFFVDAGDAVDFNNNQRAEQLLLNPVVEAKLGRHLNARLNHTLQRLDVVAGRLFEANLSQLRLIYNINVRTFVRTIFQWQEVESDPALFSFPVEPQTEELFTQLLFSYKVNPQTVIFAGYSENRFGLQNVSLTQTDRTFFLKLGYAWLF